MEVCVLLRMEHCLFISMFQILNIIDVVSQKNKTFLMLFLRSITSLGYQHNILVFGKVRSNTSDLWTFVCTAYFLSVYLCITAHQPVTGLFFNGSRERGKQKLIAQSSFINFDSNLTKNTAIPKGVEHFPKLG